MTTAETAVVERSIEQHRVALTGHCTRILGSRFDAEDAVQEALVRAWRGMDRFEGRAALGTWLHRIATNVCVDMLDGRARRPQPVDLDPDAWPGVAGVPLVVTEDDPVEAAAAREATRLALRAALHRLPPRQRAALILCEVLRWTAAEAAELLGTTPVSVNSALQRARAALADGADADSPHPLGRADRDLLARYLEAFERHDMEALSAVVREDAASAA